MSSRTEEIAVIDETEGAHERVRCWLESFSPQMHRKLRRLRYGENLEDYRKTVRRVVMAYRRYAPEELSPPAESYHVLCGSALGEDVAIVTEEWPLGVDGLVSFTAGELATLLPVIERHEQQVLEVVLRVKRAFNGARVVGVGKCSAANE